MSMAKNAQTLFLFLRSVERADNVTLNIVFFSFLCLVCEGFFSQANILMNI